MKLGKTQVASYECISTAPTAGPGMSNLEGTGSSPETVASHGMLSGASPSGQPPSQRKSGKRDRVALACQRCKTRKQKVLFLYVVPLVPAAGEKKLYIKVLEQRVAELESYLASLGHPITGNDHLRLLSQGAQTRPSSQQDVTSVQRSQSSLQTQQPSDDDTNDILIAVRDLSLSASGHYVGGSSNITIGRVLNSVVNSERASHPIVKDEQLQEQSDPAPKSIYSTNVGEMIGVHLLTPSVAEKLLHGWFRHIHTRYPILHSARLVSLHNNRGNLNEYDKTILHIVYAISGRWLESAGEMGHFFSDQHYDIAFEEMDTILSFRDSRTIDYLVLMALYCTRAPRDPGAWTYIGAAVRLCIELGLHRRPRRPNLTVAGEMTKRRFWTTYFMDRDVSFAIGRPPGISDHDIDAELPFDIPEETVDDEVVRRASTNVSNIPASPANSLTSFIHRTRLKRIESEIQHIVYRVDQPGSVPDEAVNVFLDRLTEWRETIPYEAKNYVHRQGAAYEGLELYTIHYHRCVRYLLYPKLAEQPVKPHYLKLCADACAGVLSDYRRLYHVFPVGFSALSIQSVFLAGLNLIYCAWLAPLNHINTEESLTHCQLLLYIMTERYPSAKKYRDVFERIKTAVLSLIAQGNHGPRNPVCLDSHVQAGFASFQDQVDPSLSADFSFMINTMTGNDMAGNTVTPNTMPGNSPATPFELNLDHSANALVGPYQNQPPGDVGQYPVWPSVTHDMSHSMNSMGNMYQ
ncbi:hypothetical protein DL768_002908 [Monosporascus sp. mg162]|nr:hypothetical protein DL768_002908 [Monosporascus sp. mg162]